MNQDTGGGDTADYGIEFARFFRAEGNALRLHLRHRRGSGEVTPSYFIARLKGWQTRAMKKLALLALLMADVAGISRVAAVFWTARDRSQRYTLPGVNPPDPAD